MNTALSTFLHCIQKIEAETSVSAGYCEPLDNLIESSRKLAELEERRIRNAARRNLEAYTARSTWENLEPVLADLEAIMEAAQEAGRSKVAGTLVNLNLFTIDEVRETRKNAGASSGPVHEWRVHELLEIARSLYA
jgi:hypothetical protein